jgi:hypothetical protein
LTEAGAVREGGPPLFAYAAGREAETAPENARLTHHPGRFAAI